LGPQALAVVEEETVSLASRELFPLAPETRLGEVAVVIDIPPTLPIIPGFQKVIFQKDNDGEVVCFPAHPILEGIRAHLDNEERLRNNGKDLTNVLQCSGSGSQGEADSTQ
jgi:hypothetical protein